MLTMTSCRRSGLRQNVNGRGPQRSAGTFSQARAWSFRDRCCRAGPGPRSPTSSTLPLPAGASAAAAGIGESFPPRPDQFGLYGRPIAIWA